MIRWTSIWSNSFNLFSLLFVIVYLRLFVVRYRLYLILVQESVIGSLSFTSIVVQRSPLDYPLCQALSLLKALLALVFVVSSVLSYRRQ